MRTSHRQRVFGTALALAGVLGVPGGCREEVRVVKWNPMLGNLPGAVSGTPVTSDRPGYVDPTKIPIDQLVKVDADGKKTLIAKTGRHLMIHIYNTVQDNDAPLFVDQVLSDMTKRECYQRGVDPREVFNELKRRWNDVQDLFNAMPGGEYTPGAIVKPVGAGVQRVFIQGPITRGLAWTGFDMVMEHGEWRLRWFVPAGSE